MLTNEQIQSLNELETLVFSYITNQGKAILDMKISDLAFKTHVSTTTILRFCKKAGCNGFSEFKIKYRLYLEKPKNQVYSTEISSLLDYFHKIDKEAFDKQLTKVSKVLASKKTIVLIGVGSSGVLAKYGSYTFGALGINCTYVDDPFYSLSDCDFSDTAVIVLSMSGNTVQSVEKAKMYKERNAYVISITNQKDCSLVKCSDESFCHYLNEDYYGYHNLTTQIPTMFIVESLAKKTKRIQEDTKES